MKSKAVFFVTFSFRNLVQSQKPKKFRQQMFDPARKTVVAVNFHQLYPLKTSVQLPKKIGYEFLSSPGVCVCVFFSARNVFFLDLQES